MSSHQSAYRQFHGTETALIKVMNDLLMATDRGQVSALCLLDLTAAFDTVDHGLLLSRLQQCFGIESSCLAWFTSYLTDRTYCVAVDGVFSRVIHAMCSVPQGSVLGPLLFILYTAELADIAAQHTTILHGFADDNQLYIHCQVKDVQSAAAKIENCVRAIEHWMAANRLRLNPEKTELIWIGAKNNLLKIPDGGPHLTLGGTHITSSDVVRVLGVLLTPNLLLDKHVTSLSAKCFFQLRQLRRIRRSLDDDSVATLVHAFVTSRVDYCVGLLAGAPKKTTDKLQRVLNAAARVVSNCGKYDRGLTQFWCHTLYWLEVTDRIQFRLCIQVYKCQHSMAPGYLAELCRPVSNIDGHRYLRSAGRGQLDVPRVRLSTYGGRAFCYVGPSAWNALLLLTLLAHRAHSRLFYSLMHYINYLLTYLLNLHLYFRKFSGVTPRPHNWGGASPSPDPFASARIHCPTLAHVKMSGTCITTHYHY